MTLLIMDIHLDHLLREVFHELIHQVFHHLLLSRKDWAVERVRVPIVRQRIILICWASADDV
jgi:hypothetical protein